MSETREPSPCLHLPVLKKHHNGQNIFAILYGGNRMLDVKIIKSKDIETRIRIKIPEIYRNELYAKKLEKSLSLIGGIHYVKANCITSNIIIVYNSSKIDITYIKKEIFKIKYNIKDIVSHAKEQNTLPWHVMTEKQIEKTLKTDINKGLTSFEARNRLLTYGPNQLVKNAKPSLIRVFLNQLNNYMFKILLFASGISFLIGGTADAIVIASIVVIESSLGVLQEYKAEKTLESLKKLTATTATVIRNGSKLNINSLELVPGDIVCLESGNIVPADGRIIVCTEFEVDESNLTGESVPSCKHPFVMLMENVSIADMKNMVFAGSNVVKGYARVIITGTGMSTQIGQVAKMLDSNNKALSPLKMSLETLGKNITVAIIAISTGIIISGIVRGKAIGEMLSIGLSLAIGAIPEGISTIVTIALAYSVQRMSTKNAIVRKLNSIETLGLTNIICTDKTGTLTKNEMTVKEIRSVNKIWHVTGTGYEPYGEFFRDDMPINPLYDNDLTIILQIGAMCNNSKLVYSENKWNIIGDPTEGALVTAAKKAGIDIDGSYFRIREVPFDSTKKTMTVLVNTPKGKIATVKGAPDAIIKKCTKYLKGGEIYCLNEFDINTILKHNDEMSNKALRVLAVAYKIFEDLDSDIENGLIFAGLIGIEDPPREKVRDAIEECLNSGIDVVMITGDQKNTALSLAHKVGLLGNKKAISGDELDHMSDEELKNSIDGIRIFYRTTPKHKLRIVKAFKEKGFIVTMTGDGINDAPAVKEANVGIAMGKSGTDVTREASDITITDDNFTTIVMAVKEGQNLSGNIKKFLRYVLSGNVGEIIVLASSAITGMPMPLTSSQILSINLVTEGIPALSLGLEPSSTSLSTNAKKAFLDEKLYKCIITRGSLIGLTTLGVFKYALFKGNLNYAKTMAYSNLIMCQMFNVFDSRRTNGYNIQPYNKMLVPSVVISVIFLITTIYLGPISSVFGTFPLSLSDWGIILLSSGVLSRIDNKF